MSSMDEVQSELLQQQRDTEGDKEQAVEKKREDEQGDGGGDEPITPALNPDSPILKPNRPRIDVTDYENYDIYGVDATWTNQYGGPSSDFNGFRIQYAEPIEDLIRLVARHVEAGLYKVVCMTATEHTLVVVCRCKKMWKDFPPGMFGLK